MYTVWYKGDSDEPEVVGRTTDIEKAEYMAANATPWHSEWRTWVEDADGHILATFSPETLAFGLKCVMRR